MEQRIKDNESGKKGNKSFDLLNYLLAKRDYFPNVVDVVDEIIDFFAAAAETTQAATTTIVSQMIKNPEMLD